MSSDEIAAPLFSHGRVIMSAGVLALVQQEALNVPLYLERHLGGDWGDVTPQRSRANDQGIGNREMLFSRYTLRPDLLLYVITSGDRTITSMWLVARVLIQT